MEATSLRQLTAYTAVALAASFTTAAAEMHVSRSSLSRAAADASSSAWGVGVFAGHASQLKDS